MLKDWVMVNPVKDARKALLSSSSCYNELIASTSLVKRAMAKKRKQNQPPRRKRMKRAQRLQSARSWLETYEGNKVVRDYRRRYGVSWEDAFTELALLGVSIDPDYKERVLQSVAAQAAARRRKREARKAEQERAASVESDERFAFIVGYTSGGAPYGLTWEEWEALEPSDLEEE